MLESLHISNYALIDRIDINFSAGFNVITGETGAGKSIILGALGLILGGRADSRVVTDPSAKSVIEASFALNSCSALKAYCAEADIEWDDAHCILRREIAPNGRSRAFVNDSPVPLSKLQGVAMYLIDIHSQHQNQLLATPEFQLKVIDTLAGNAERLKVYSSRFTTLREAIRRLKAAKLRVEKSREDEEFTRYQLEQLQDLNLHPGEQAELEQERTVLSNLTNIKSALAQAVNALTMGAANAVDLVGEAMDAADTFADLLSEREADIPERLESARLELADIASTIESLDESLSADPSRLMEVEERLNTIYSLTHKHRVASGEELIALREALTRKLDALDSSDEAIEALAREARRAKELAMETANEISAARKAAAEQFALHLTEVAKPLGMKNLRVEVQVNRADMNSTGIDSVLFMVAFNKNQAPMPVGATASGGEVSRLMLSIKSIIASRMELPSIIFDEIDTGVSGDVAHRMGQMMRAISRSIQVTAITHLPQVAAKGDVHFRVYKEDDDLSTHTHISLLDSEERVWFIASMLGTEPVDDTALAAARTLLSNKEL